jgi:hypothetical protein
MSRGKSTNNLRRSSGNNNPRKNLLIVVEGQETEYNYFNSLKYELKLATISIVKIVPAGGGDPFVIVCEAYKAYNSNSPKFDQVFCVFDDDNKPEKYKKALSTAKEYNFTAITSIPCFEFWFLLHYCYTTSPCSSYKELRPKLEAEMRKAAILKQGQTYDKLLYEKLRPNQDKAINNAVKLAQNHPNLDKCSNPSTEVHLLIEELKKQKDFKP